MADCVAAAKMNGLGNAILIMDMRGRHERLSVEFVRHLAHNPQSAFDQLMLLYDAPPPQQEAGRAERPTGTTENAAGRGAQMRESDIWQEKTMRESDIWQEKTRGAADLPYRVEIRNQDGTEAQACGNGTRCLAEWLYAYQPAAKAAEKRGKGAALFRFITKGGFITAERAENGRITVDMGKPSFAPRALPLRLRPADMRRVPLQALLPAAARRPFAAKLALFPPRAALLSVGNPHAVFFTEKPLLPLEDYPLAAFGAMLEKSPVFPEGVNVSLAQIVSPAFMRLRVWERGAGLTEACGSAACAAQAAARKLGLTQAEAAISLPGGRLSVLIKQGRCLLSGAAEYEYGGAVSLSAGDFIRREHS